MKHFPDYIIGGTIGALAMAALFLMDEAKRTPNIEPSELEFKCKDLKPETVIKIDNTPYLLKCDENGKPVLSEVNHKECNLTGCPYDAWVRHLSRNW